MLSKWTAILTILLTVFGALYVVGTFIAVPGNLIFEGLADTTDLWANLFASLIVIIGIERILHRSKLEKSRTSRAYIEGRVLHGLIELMENMRVPSSWRERLEAGDAFEDFYERIHSSREQGLNEIETIIDNYSNLLEPDLINEVFRLIGILRSYTFLGYSQRDAWNLADAASFSTAVLSQSKEIVEHYNLLNSMGVAISFREGEPPRVSLGNSGICEATQYTYYSEWLIESIAFRDECCSRRRNNA